MRRFLLVALLAVGCTPASHRLARRLEGHYAIGLPGDGWILVDPGGADHAWYNATLAASIYADSNCGPRYAETRTEDLATELTAGLREMTTSRNEARVIGDREGVLRVHTGRLDGVAMTVALGVVNQNACTYDLTLIAPPAAFDAGWPAYERVLAGFHPS
jgi:hypothetical protein